MTSDAEILLIEGQKSRFCVNLRVHLEEYRAQHGHAGQVRPVLEVTQQMAEAAAGRRQECLQVGFSVLWQARLSGPGDEEAPPANLTQQETLHCA